MNVLAVTEKVTVWKASAFDSSGEINMQEGDLLNVMHTPPVTLLDKPGFHTDGVRLLDANGKEFLMRGYNYSYAWQKDLWGAAFSTAKKYKCNALRIQLSDGQKSLGGYCDANQVSSLIKSCKDNRFIGVFNVQDTGGGNDKNVLLHAADYWVGIKNAVIGQ